MKSLNAGEVKTSTRKDDWWGLTQTSRQDQELGGKNSQVSVTMIKQKNVRLEYLGSKFNQGWGS